MTPTAECQGEDQEPGNIESLMLKSEHTITEQRTLNQPTSYSEKELFLTISYLLWTVHADFADHDFCITMLLSDDQIILRHAGATASVCSLVVHVPIF